MITIQRKRAIEKAKIDWYFVNTERKNKMKKWIILSTAIMTFSMTLIALASDTISNENSPYFYISNQGGMYQLSKEQYEEVTLYHNLGEVILRDSLEKIPQKSFIEVQSEKEAEPTYSSK